MRNKGNNIQQTIIAQFCLKWQKTLGITNNQINNPVGARFFFDFLLNFPQDCNKELQHTRLYY